MDKRRPVDYAIKHTGQSPAVRWQTGFFPQISQDLLRFISVRECQARNQLFRRRECKQKARDCSSRWPNWLRSALRLQKRSDVASRFYCYGVSAACMLSVHTDCAYCTLAACALTACTLAGCTGIPVYTLCVPSIAQRVVHCQTQSRRCTTKKPFKTALGKNLKSRRN